MTLGGRGIRRERAKSTAQKAGLDEVKGIPASATGRPGPAGPNGLLRQSPEELLEGLAQDQQAARLWESLLAITPSRRRERVRDLGECRDPRARKLLAAALWDEETAVALAAVEGLRGLGDSHSAESLAWLAEISRVERAAAAARAAIEEIRARSGAGDGERPELADGREYWASFIDGAGSQLLMAVRPAGEGADSERMRFASVAVSDQRGIMDAAGIDSAARAEVESLRTGGSRRAGERGWRRGGRASSAAREEELPEIGWVRVDAEYCAAALEAARRIHCRDHRRLPGVWEFWRADFAGPAGPGAPALEDRALPDGQLRRRLSQTTTLIHFEGFRSWLILGEDLAPFLPAALQAWARRGRAREDGLAQVISACLESGVKGRQRRLWRSRLLRQAALWERRGDWIVRELCLAAAWGLDDRNGVPSEQHPLLRAMARASLELAKGA